jgi:hypothetical protein
MARRDHAGGSRQCGPADCILTDMHVFSYTAPGARPELLSIDGLDDRVEVRVRGPQGGAGEMPEACMTLPEAQVLALFRALHDYLAAKGEAAP